jgi:hypothetical protein
MVWEIKFTCLNPLVHYKTTLSDRTSGNLNFHVEIMPKTEISQRNIPMLSWRVLVATRVVALSSKTIASKPNHFLISSARIAISLKADVLAL